MSELDGLWRQIEALDDSDREWLTLRLVHTTRGPWWTGAGLQGWGSGIDKSADVCGGSARILRTRIPVWVLEQLRRLGMREAEILASYPTLRAEDLVRAWSYVERHPDEIAEEIRANEEVPAKRG